MSEAFEPITIDYDCSAGERAEAQAILTTKPNAKPPPPSPAGSRVARGLFGWVLFIALAVMLFVLLKQRDATQSGGDQVSQPFGTGVIVAFAVVGFGVAMIAVGSVLIAVADRDDRERWRGQTKWTFETDGVTYSVPGRRETYRWGFFARFDESANVLLLRFQATQALIFPRRLFAGEEYECVRGLLRSRLTVPAIPQALGFPVQTHDA